MTTLIIDTDKFIASARQLGKTELRGVIADHLAGWQPTDTHRNTWPAGLQHDTRVDIRMRDGSEFKGTPAYTWAWGEARGTTITHWRYAQ